MIGKKILHYQIIEKLGEGGMGIVYLAEDTRLERKVAIKFLPRHIAASQEERRRFEIEAKAAAALNHPNIATVYAIEEAGDDVFIVMEYIEGQELKELIADVEPGSKPAPAIDDITNIATQIAEGLQAAHGKGIVHRDIKSNNIMVKESGQVKIMDFGLAKIVGGPQVTKSGTTLGTVAYMSPEQALGDEIDQRTDIWSFGVVLYEMLTGELPFKGEYEQAIIYSIANKAPEPLAGLRGDAPKTLEKIVNKALSKSLDERYGKVSEMLVDLKTLQERSKSLSLTSNTTEEAPSRQKRILLYTGSAIFFILFLVAIFYSTNQGAGKEINSIAVLPLDNYSGDSQQEYFADGMTEALITDLAQIRSLRVISRTSVMQYKGKQKPLTDIAQELNVDAVLEGSAYQDGKRVRITVQLIEAATDRHLWAESYERDLTDILALHSEVAQAVVREIKIVLTAEEKNRLAIARPVDPAAHEAYLKGQYYLQQSTSGAGSVDQLRSGIEYFQQAIELDPDWALAHAALARAYHFLASGRDQFEYFPKSKAAALKALEIDETVSQAHSALAFVLHWYDWDWEGAEREYRRANELNPNAYGWGTALFLASAGRFEDAIQWFKRTEKRNPLILEVKAQLGHAYTRAGQYDEAIAHLHTTLELNPNLAWARYVLADTYLRLSMHQEAIAESQKAVASGAGKPEFLAQLGYAYTVAGQKEKALKVLEEYRAKNGDFFVNELAALYLALGWKDEALALLQKALVERSSNLLSIKCSILADRLKDNPSFQAIIRGIQFPEGAIQIEAPE